MKSRYQVLVLMLSTVLSDCNGQKEFGNKYVSLQKTIELPDVNGRIDHLAIDEFRHIAYMAALGNNTVEVIDLPAGKDIRTIKNLHEPQGVEYLSFSHSIFVANGGTGICNFLDATTFQPKAALDFKDDADDVRYLSNDKTIYVGFGNGGIAIINEETKSEIGKIPLKGHPEGFQVDAKSKRIWVNVPTANLIEVLDGKNLKEITQWKTDGLNANFPMAYDSVRHRLFVCFRSPARLLILDSETGQHIASLPCAGDADDLFYDAGIKKIIVTGGSGYIDIFSQDSENAWSQAAHVFSAKGARTSLLIPATHELLLAVPRKAGQTAALRIYKLF